MEIASGLGLGACILPPLSALGPQKICFPFSFPMQVRLLKFSASRKKKKNGTKSNKTGLQDKACFFYASLVLQTTVVRNWSRHSKYKPTVFPVCRWSVVIEAHSNEQLLNI